MLVDLDDAPFDLVLHDQLRTGLESDFQQLLTDREMNPSLLLLPFDQAIQVGILIFEEVLDRHHLPFSPQQSLGNSQ